MACTGRAPSKLCQNVSVPDGACADFSVRTRPPHIASMSQACINPTFPDFRTFRTPHTRARSSSLNPDYIYMKRMMKKKIPRVRKALEAVSCVRTCAVCGMCGSSQTSINPSFPRSFMCAEVVCGGLVPHTAPKSRSMPAKFPASEKRPSFFACMFARSVLSTATQGAVNAEPAFTGRILSAGILSSRLVPADLFSQRDERTMRCKSCDTRVFPRHAEK